MPDTYFVQTYRLTVGPLPSLAAACGLADLMRGHRDAYPHAPDILSGVQYADAFRRGDTAKAQTLMTFLETR